MEVWNAAPLAPLPSMIIKRRGDANSSVVLSMAVQRLFSEKPVNLAKKKKKMMSSSLRVGISFALRKTASSFNLPPVLTFSIAANSQLLRGLQFC
jgi:hypothetical protein